MYHGSPILSAKNERLGRGLRIIHEEPEDDARGHLRWWKNVWDPDYDNLLDLVLVVVPSAKAIQAIESMLCAWSAGDDVEDGGELRWKDESEDL